MKKILFIAASAMLVLASCTNDESAPEQIEIGFNALTKKNAQAKSIITGGTFDTDSTFRVWGFADQDADPTVALDVDITGTSEPNFMYTTKTTGSTKLDGVEISYVGTSWKNANRSFYWPLTGKVGFYALYPANQPLTSLTWAGGMRIDDYTITSSNSSGLGAVDLMYAYGEGSRSTAKQDMVFKHALSQVLFKFRTDLNDANVTITVKSVKLNNVDLIGNFTFIKSSTPLGSWGSNTNQTLGFDYCISDSVVIYADLVSGAQAYGASTLMIPQAITATQNASVEFVVAQNGSDPITYTLPIPLTCADNKWDLAKQYVYTVTFKMNEILFNPSITEWSDVISSSIDLYE